MKRGRREADQLPKQIEDDQLTKQISELVKQKKPLPEKIEDLVSLMFVGQAAVSLYRTKIKLMDDLEVTEERFKVTLGNGQQAGELLLDIEAKIGELLPDPDDAIAMGAREGPRIRDGKQAIPLSRPKGITAQHAHQARLINDYPEIVERMKARARANEEIVTRTTVVKEIKREKAKGRLVPKGKFKPCYVCQRQPGWRADRCTECITRFDRINFEACFACQSKPNWEPDGCGECKHMEMTPNDLRHIAFVNSMSESCATAIRQQLVEKSKQQKGKKKQAAEKE